MMRVFGSITFLVSAAMSAVAIAQPYGGWGGWGGWGGGYHSSTVEEGIQRGHADVIRSRGAANLMNSEAAGNYQDAYKKYLDNRMDATNTYFEMRAANRAYREAERGPRATREQLERLAKLRAPEPLSPSELDPLTGQIEWPLLLQQDDFAENRTKLDQLYAERAEKGHLTFDQMNQVKQVSTAMQYDLKANIDRYPPQQYVQSKKFLEGLATAVFMQAS